MKNGHKYLNSSAVRRNRVSRNRVALNRLDHPPTAATSCPAAAVRISTTAPQLVDAQDARLPAIARSRRSTVVRSAASLARRCVIVVCAWITVE